VLDSVDCIASLYEQFSNDKPSRLGRWASGVEYRKLKGYEPTEASRFDRVIVTSETDKQALLRLAPDLAVDVISNGVDSEYYVPHGGSREGAEIVFWGKMSYYANESAAVYLCRDLLPRIRRREPGTRVTIVGSAPSRVLRRFASRDGIRVTGYVPDIRVCLRTARVAAFPIRAGAGIQNKVLEALALGIPVVATSKACQALSVLDGEHLLVADDPDEFAQAVVRVIREDDVAERLAQNGRQYVEENHDWDDKASQLEATYRSAAVSQKDRTRVV
jgi:glycosyltransferase involved in cell wall biosynthesis